MKNLIIGMLFLGLTSLVYSQNLVSEVKNITKEEMIRPEVPNGVYLSKVFDPTTPKHIEVLEKRASQFDIQKTFEYDQRKELFLVKFKATNGEFVVSYDTNGTINSSVGKFKNGPVPILLLKEISKKYPGWKMMKNFYHSNYDIENGYVKYYEVLLREGKSRKLVKLDAVGNFI